MPAPSSSEAPRIPRTQSMPPAPHLLARPIVRIAALAHIMRLVTVYYEIVGEMSSSMEVGGELATASKCNCY